MDADPVTVAIPVLNGGARLTETLTAVRSQRVDRELELLVADSGSTDGSREQAERHGARVLDVPRERFSHGGTRNLLAGEAAGAHVAFLTQDSVPADALWLARLLEGFELADDLALVFGPYRPRSEASHMVRRELTEWFGSFAPDGSPKVDRETSTPESEADRARAAYFTDANGCLLRRAWEQVPFRAVEYAEDQMLAADMLAAGWAKAYQPLAVVEHSHDYPPFTLFRRSFDEWRGLREARGLDAPGNPWRMALTVQRRVRDDLRFLREEQAGPAARARGALRSTAHHTARALGAALGSRAHALSPSLRRALSLERRA